MLPNFKPKNGHYLVAGTSNHALFGYGITGFSFLDGQFFRTLIETGLLGLAAFIWLMTGVHKTIWKTMHTEIESPKLKGMVIGFYAGFWALMAHAMTANTFIIVRIAEPFWCLAGLVVIIMTLKKDGLETKSELSAVQ